MIADNEQAKPALYPWYAIRTRSNHERIAGTILEEKGYESYLPLYQTKRRWSDRVVEAEKPLFPGYLFCRFDRKEQLPILTTAGVAGIVGFGLEPEPVPETEIDAVQALLRSGLRVEPSMLLHEGQRVRVKRGALEGLEGTLIKKKSEWRFVVSITMLQRSISVEIDSDWITPLPPC
jgi:transcription antitermination factor NusG